MFSGGFCESLEFRGPTGDSEASRDLLIAVGDDGVLAEILVGCTWRHSHVSPQLLTLALARGCWSSCLCAQVLATRIAEDNG